MISNPIPWPNGARCACVISFDMDADSLIHIARPDDSHDRLYPISWDDMVLTLQCRAF